MARANHRYDLPSHHPWPRLYLSDEVVKWGGSGGTAMTRVCTLDWWSYQDVAFYVLESPAIGTYQLYVSKSIYAEAIWFLTNADYMSVTGCNGSFHLTNDRYGASPTSQNGDIVFYMGRKGGYPSSNWDTVSAQTSVTSDSRGAWEPGAPGVGAGYGVTGQDSAGSALGVSMAFQPLPTPTPTATPSPTSSLTPSATWTPSPTPTATSTATATPTPTALPDVIFADGFESGGLTAWSSNSNGSGSLTVTIGAALAGSYGMQALVNTTATRYVQDSIPYLETRYRARFLFDPNSLAMANGDAFILFYGYHGTTATLRVELRYETANGYRLRVDAANNGNAFTNHSNWLNITDTSHFVELDWQSATSGRVDWWLDGAPQASVTGFDNSTRRIDMVRLGTVTGLDAGTSGTIFFDAFESRRYTYIGSGTSLPDHIFADGFESGGFGYWSANTGVVVASEAALSPEGTKGMSVPIALATTTAKYVTDNVPGIEPRYRARFYFDPNAITMANNADHVIFYGDSGTTPVLEVDLGFTTASGYRLRTRIRDNANVWNNSAWVDITDAPHVLELDWQSGTSGSLAWWIDEASQPAPSPINNSSRWIDRVRMGAAANIDATTSGTMFFDAFESRRQTYIGPVGWVPPPVLSVWTQYYYVGGQRIAMRIREGARNDLYYLLSDHLGSTALTVGETGIVLGEMRYKAWGETRYAWGSTPSEYRYTSQRQDTDIGLYYYRARWYDPALGRFAQADTIVAGVAWNGDGHGVGLDHDVSLSPLTMAFNEPEVLAASNAENASVMRCPSWFNLCGQDNEEAKLARLPSNPQALDRYAYAFNNPLAYSDPSGHFLLLPELVLITVGAIMVAGAVAIYELYYAPNAPYGDVPIAPSLDGVLSGWEEGGESLQALGRLILTIGTNVLRTETRRTSDGRTVRVRPLEDREVPKEWERDKQKGWKPRDRIWIDEETGDTFVGGDEGELESWP